MFDRPYHGRVPGGDRHRPPWRLLVESADPALAISDFGAYREAGFDVALCEGPQFEAAECPLVRGEGCPYASSADVVLFDLGDDAEARLQVLEKMLATVPDLPIVVRTTGPAPRRAGGFALIRSNTSVAGQIRVLHEAIRSAAVSVHSQPSQHSDA
jgi:hypothetical protein